MCIPCLGWRRKETFTGGNTEATGSAETNEGGKLIQGDKSAEEMMGETKHLTSMEK